MLAVVAATSLGLPKTTSPNLNNLDAKISPVSVDGEEDYPDNAEGSPSSSSGDDDEDADNSLKAYPASQSRVATLCFRNYHPRSRIAKTIVNPNRNASQSYVKQHGRKISPRRKPVQCK